MEVAWPGPMESSLRAFEGIRVSKSTKLSTVFDVFKNVVDCLRSGEGLLGELKERVQALCIPLERENLGKTELSMANYVIKATEIQELLEEEVVAYSILKKIFHLRLSLLNHPRYEELRSSRFAELGMSLGIERGKKPSDKKELPSKGSELPPVEGGLESIVSELQETEVLGEDEKFDRTMMNLIKGYQYENKTYTILDNKSKGVCERYIHAENQVIRQFAKFLFRIHEQKEMIDRHDVLMHMGATLVGLFIASSTEYFFSSKREKITPVIGMCMLKKNHCEEGKEDFGTKIFERCFMEDVLRSDATFFQINRAIFCLILRIRKKWEEIYAGFRTHQKMTTYATLMKENVKSITSGTIQYMIGQHLQKILCMKKQKERFPLTEISPICQTKEAFQELYHIDGLIACCDEPEVKKAPKKRGKAVIEKRSEVKVDSRGGAGGAGLGSDSEDEVAAVERPVGFDIGEIQIAPRIQAWLESEADGLRYYRATEVGKTAHSDEVIILSHKISIEFLPFLLNPEYSNEGTWITASGEHHPHWEGIMYREGRKYKIEATINNDNVLYHYAMRPIGKVLDYAMTWQAPSEFPPLGSAKSPLVKSRVALQQDEFGNVVLGAFKLLKLR